MNQPEKIAERLEAQFLNAELMEEAAALIRSLIRERDAVEAAYQKHIFDKGLTEDSLDPATLEGEVWFALTRPQRERREGAR